MQNLEIKCRYPDLDRAGRLAHESLQAEFDGEVEQVDTYFDTPRGRLKLRRTTGPRALESAAELIFYRRPDLHGPRISDYSRLPVEDPVDMLAFLRAALGVKVVVHKRRMIYLKENIRVHLDRVRGLGKYLEFELIVSRTHPRAACRRQMAALREMFGIAPGDLLSGSYAEMV